MRSSVRPPDQVQSCNVLIPEEKASALLEHVHDWAANSIPGDQSVATVAVPASPKIPTSGLPPVSWR